MLNISFEEIVPYTQEVLIIFTSPKGLSYPAMLYFLWCPILYFLGR